MDYKFLNRVVEQIISETWIDWDEGMVNVPFHPFFLGPLNFVNQNNISQNHHFTELFS